MRREALYLRDIVEAADHISSFITGLDFSGFQESELIRSAVVQKLSVIGEAAGRCSEELKAGHSEIPWPRIVAFSNILVHAYFGIHWAEVWIAANRDVPKLRDQVTAILGADFRA